MPDIDLHQLINLPGAGNAEKALRKAGKWQLTKEEKIERVISDIADSISIAEDAISDADNHLERLINAMEATE